MLHIASGDRWAGAEVQLYTLLSQLQRRDDIEPRAILMNDGELAERLRAIAVPVDILDESRLSAIAILRGLRLLLAQHRPDIVHTHRQKENILGAIANRLSVRAASLRTVHGAEEHPPRGLRQLPKRLIRALDRWVGNHLHQRVIAVSQPLAELLAAQFVTEQIAVIENGVDIDAVRATVKPVEFREREPQAIHIGLVGRLDPVKRVDIFLQMARQLCSEEPGKPWRFHVFGDGALRPSLQQQALQLGLSEQVYFHGHRRDIASCIAALDALVICSDHEGLPMTTLEALAIGTPVLAHAVGGLNTVLSDDSGGLLVKNHSPAGYAQALQHMLTRDHRAMAAQGFEAVQQRYSAAVNAAHMQQLYQQLIREKSHRL